MEFMFLFMTPAGTPQADDEGMAEMGAYAAELAARRKLRRGAPLASDGDGGARVRVRDQRVVSSDGPFAESKEVVAGFWIVEAADRAEALELARACPHARYGPMEMHAIDRRYQFKDLSRGTPFFFGYLATPDLDDTGHAKRREMLEFGQSLPEGTVFETAPLARPEPKAARIEPRDGKLLVTDGPFAEAKESVAGYALVRSADRRAALALAGRFPHAKWGTVEVREIRFFDPT